MEDAPLRILLIEDNRLDTLLIKEMLEGTDCEVTNAARLSAGLGLLETRHFDLILLDLGLPDSWGLEGLEKIQNSGSNVPVVVLTGLSDEALASRSLAMGAQDYVLKGHTDSELLYRTIRYSIERKKSRQQLEESEERFRRAIMDSVFPVMIHAEDGEVIQINRIWTQLTGYAIEDIPAVSVWLEKASAAAPDTRIGQGEHVIRTKSGDSRTWEFSSVPLGSLHDGRKLIMSMAADITERKRMEEIIKHQASHDTLTGLPNRALFMDRLSQEISERRRNGKKLAVIFLDLDRFKNINDTLGHDAGDRLLVEVGGRLKTCIRESDTVARIGGDEFNEKKTGKKPVLLKKDKQTVYFFPMKGKPPIADEYINVEPNSYGGSAKTIISITKKIKKGKK